MSWNAADFREAAMLAVRLIMKKGAEYSNNPRDIMSLVIQDNKTCKLCAVSETYRYLKANPDTKISVKGSETYLVPAESLNGERYVRSELNTSTVDALMQLPRCKVLGK